MIQNFIKQHWIIISLVITGAIAGYAFWYFIGCTTGTCPLTSNWYYNTGFGMFGGYILGDFIHDTKKKRAEKRMQGQ